MSEKMRYGCPKCLPDSPDEAWEAGLKLRGRHALIDDSHFHVLIASCPSCGQPFLWVFSELIDWQSGDDSQGWALMPLTSAEEGELSSGNFFANGRSVYDLGEDRRSLWRIHPRGSDVGCSWGLGIPALPHD